MKKTLLSASAALGLAACAGAPNAAPADAPMAAASAIASVLPTTDTSFYPAWSRGASMYEVNVRQYTPEGTFAALERHLPRLRGMGVDILCG